MIFSPKNISVNDSVEISIAVKNTGKYIGDEVVMLYIKNVQS